MKKKAIIAMACATICLSISLNIFLIARGGYLHKLNILIGIEQETIETDWAVKSWSNCLDQLDLDVDIAYPSNNRASGNRINIVI